MTDRSGTVMGVDGCRYGWVGVVVDHDRWTLRVETDIDALTRWATDELGLPHVIAIDIPIGLPDFGKRDADVLAAASLGRKHSSVFTTPIRDAISASDHAEANRLNRERIGAGVSAQAYALRSKVLEVDRWAPTAPTRVVEVHPELSFAAIAGEPVMAGKRTPEGQDLRLRLLRSVGLDLAPALDDHRPGAAADDVLDATAAAWTAKRVLDRSARCLPDPPQTFSDGWPAAIWT
jgi:predicted RNase H-like nuclease